MIDRIWETLVRWRTYFLNIILALLFVAPEVLNSPEILAIIPAEYQRWFLAAAFLANIWMRPRAAATKNDAEVQVRELVKAADGPTTVVVKAADGETRAIIDA
jgi:hypothetical protein